MKIKRPKNCRKSVKKWHDKGSLFYINTFGTTLENYLPQFVLKVENKGIYEKINIENEKYNDNFDTYIRPSIIKDKGYAFIEYVGYLDFESAYNMALEYKNEQQEKFGISPNIFIYKDFCYMLLNKYKNKEKREAFHSIEMELYIKKYTYGISRHTKKGLEQSQNLTRKILGIKGQ